jgi:Zn-dependent protease
MPLETALAIPYLIDPWHFALDDVVTFCLAVLIAVTVNSEAQSLTAALLGDSRPGATDRLHFNVFLHLDVWGAICFLVGGFGWARRVKYDSSKFSHPRLHMVLTRFAGPVANFLMANIALSIVWLLGSMATDARVFLMIAIVNLTVAVFNILPVPPLAGASLLSALFPDQYKKFQDSFDLSGPFLLIGLFLIERISHTKFISGYLDPIVRALFDYIKI